MRVGREDLGKAVMPCVNFERCAGQIELRVVRETRIAETGSEATTLHGDDVMQTCVCELSEGQREDVVARAEAALAQP
jgi:hypothetical protein